MTSNGSVFYDGHEERVEKCQAASATTACPTSGTTGTLYWRGTGSDTLAETDLGGNDEEEYLFFGGERIARRDTSATGATIAIHYYFSDHLGSHGVVENATGTTCEQDIDYYPYGGVEEDYCSGSGVAQNYKFTGKERDNESGLDNFGARFDASSLGRFMSADPQPAKHLRNPQDLNSYSYTVNNPLRYVDPNGRDWATAWSDVKAFAQSVYIGVSIGVGLELSGTKGSIEGKVGVAFKGTLETSKEAAVQVSKSVEGGAKFGPKDGVQVGENVAVSQTVLTANPGKVTGAETPTVEITDSIGGNTTANSSGDRVGIGFEVGAIALAGAEIGATKDGWSALGDAFAQVKNEIILPSPPPPTAPPAPPLTGTAATKAPDSNAGSSD
jgi:RHS repeat-associated protein